jgi:Ham1 family
MTPGGATLILATRNPGKLAELRRILAASGVDVTVADLEDRPDMPEVAETGATFVENALLKARAVGAHTGLPAVAEDSGLCVDALNGMPGVLSARWSGRHGDDEANLRGCGGAGAAVRGRARHRGHGQRLARRRTARDQRVRLRPDLRAGLVPADHGADEPGGEGRDQPPGPGAARHGADHRGPAGRVGPVR